MLNQDTESSQDNKDANSEEDDKNLFFTYNNPAKYCHELEKKYVHDVYERTAHFFTEANYKAWPKVRQFLEHLQTGSIVLDIGCGHGKYLQLNKNIYKIGSDYSEKLITIARQNGHQVTVSNNLHLPYRSGCCDAVLSIGVIHHFTTTQRRIQAIQELTRVLAIGGKIIIYVWALEQTRRKFKAQDVLVPWHLKVRKNTHKTALICNGSMSDDDVPIIGNAGEDVTYNQQGTSIESSKKSSHEKNLLKMSDNQSSSLDLSTVRNTELCNNVCDHESHQNNTCSNKLNSDSLIATNSHPLSCAKVCVHIPPSHEELTPSSVNQNYTRVDIEEKLRIKAHPGNFDISNNSKVVHTNQCSIKESQSPSAFNQHFVAPYLEGAKRNISKTIESKANAKSLGMFDLIKSKLYNIFVGPKENDVPDISINENEYHDINIPEHAKALLSLSCNTLPAPFCNGFAVREFPLSSQSAGEKNVKHDSSMKIADNLDKSANCNGLSQFSEVKSKPQVPPIESKTIKTNQYVQTKVNVEVSRQEVSSSKIMSNVNIASQNLSKEQQIQNGENEVEVSNEMNNLHICSEFDWFQCTENAIKTIEANSVVCDMNSSLKNVIPKNVSSSRAVASPKIAKRNLSASSSFSSFSSEPYSDSEIEETSFGVNDALTRRNQVMPNFVGSKEVSNGSHMSVDDKNNGYFSSQSFIRKKNKEHNVYKSVETSNNISKDEDLFKRYYHVFRKNELDELISKNIKGLKILSSQYDHANYCIIAEKIEN